MVEDDEVLLDFEASDAMAAAPSDPRAAAWVLLVAAKYLRSGEKMPHDLRCYLADAFDRSMKKSAPYRNKALLLALHLSSSGRRPVKVSYLDTGQAFDALIESGESPNSAKSQVAADFGISESTAVRQWKQYRAAMEEYSRICRGELD